MVRSSPLLHIDSHMQIARRATLGPGLPMPGHTNGTAHFSLEGMPADMPGHLDFGALRLCAMEDVDPALSPGFPMHPHAEMEIMTVVVRGEVDHRDDIGGTTILRTGDVLVTTAGRGTEHEEMPHGTAIARYVQILIDPRERGLEPRVAMGSFSDRKGGWRTLVSGRDGAPPDALPMAQDAALMGCILDRGEVATAPASYGRRGYVLVTDGTVRVNGEAVEQGERVLITDGPEISLEALTDAELLFVDLP